MRRVNVLIAILALIGFLTLSIETLERVGHFQMPREKLETSIGIEHSKPLALGIEMAQRTRIIPPEEPGGPQSHVIYGQARLTLRSNEETFISVPSSWKREEVRGPSITQVQGDDPQFGFTRWKMPPNVEVLFAVPQIPDHLLAQNPSGVPVKVTITRIDLDRETVEKDVKLIERRVTELW